MSLTTPKYNLNAFPSVYEPSEDTFLFLDALELETEYLQSLKPALCVEIGSGSGVLSTALSTIIKSVTIATDVNISACQATLQTSNFNHQLVDSCQMDLLTQFRPKLFDVILFNPPYVPTIEAEISDGGFGLNRAWAGGARGRIITDRLLDVLHNVLSDSGVLYLLLLKENNVEDVNDIMDTRGFKSTLVIDRKIPGEHLYIFKYYRK